MNRPGKRTNHYSTMRTKAQRLLPKQGRERGQGQQTEYVQGGLNTFYLGSLRRTKAVEVEAFVAGRN